MNLTKQETTMTPPAFSVEEIEQAIEQGLAVITLMQLRDALQSGQVAILSREDRENGYELAWQSGFQAGSNEITRLEGTQSQDDALKARTLLQLDGGTTP